MSTSCAAAAKLALTDDDLARRSFYSSDPQLHRILQRDVHIDFCFSLVINGKDGKKPRLGRITRNENGGFCGTCSWCSLLQEGSRRTLECGTLDSLLRDWSHGQYRAEQVQILVHLHTLEYYREPPRNLMDKSRVAAGKAFLLAVRGSAGLKVDDPSLRSINSTDDFTVPFEIYAEENDPAANYLNIHRRPLDDATLSDSNVNKIMGWLKACDKNHKKCQGSQILPSRLVYVEAENVRLITTLHLKQDTRYIALSYCWGSPEDAKLPLTTTHSTIAQRLDNIPIDIMPKTFQDAIIVARALQIQFLWIDSLCIVQDDKQDWQVESSRMADIFSNAYLTVVAAAGSSCHDSFLYRETNRACCTIPFRSVKDPLRSGYYSLRHRPGRKWWSPDDKMAEISGHHWIGRGWTFQEERLAKRVLMFGESKFFFDCRSEERVEDTEVRGMRPDWTEIVHEEFEPWRHQSGIRAAIGASHNRPRPFDHWLTLCDHYSRRVLTFPQDKLPAISGIASKISQKTGSDYLAGLWRDHLMHGLFWQTVHATKRPPDYRAPSWTWAALDGQIRWEKWSCSEDDGCNLYCEILDAQTTVMGRDPFGAVSDGYLKLSAVALEAELLRAESNQIPRYPWRLLIDRVELAMADIDVEDTNWSDKKIWAVLVANCTGQNSLPRGLLLQETGQQRDGIYEYQRIGVFKVINDAIEHRMGIWAESARQLIMIV